MTSIHEKLLDIYTSEYEKLKAEQLQRITFRDVQIPFSIFLGTAPILSIAFRQGNTFGYHLLLIVPLICVSLGWAYVSNDEKISTIGDYIRVEVKGRLKVAIKEIEPQKTINPILEELIFGWENFHKHDQYKEERKVTQLFVNLLTFVFSGIAVLLTFLSLQGSSGIQTPISTLNSLGKGWESISIPLKLVIGFESICLLILGWWICVYSNFRKNFRALRLKWKSRFFRKASSTR